MFLRIHILFVLFALITQSLCECPQKDLLKPCVCDDKLDEIRCGGIDLSGIDIDVFEIFKNLSKHLSKDKKHFKSFYLNNKAINELKENTFNEITFDIIEIDYCPNLTRIDKNAFSGNYLVTKSLIINDNHKLISQDNSIFEIFSKFLNIETIVFKNNENIKEIPSNAFKNMIGYQNQFNTLYIQGGIERIGERAFSMLRNLNNVTITSSPLNYISDFAFKFEEYSNTTLIIDLQYSWQINSTSFSTKSLSKIRRPTKLLFNNYKENDFTYLDEKVFSSLFSENDKNTIDLNIVSFDCDNCNNVWLKYHPDYLKRISNLTCSNRRKFNDSRNFEYCGQISQLVKPCHYKDGRISCDGNNEFDLEMVFESLSDNLGDDQKHFKYFVLNNTAINEIKENTFKDIMFDEIYIRDCESLTFIHRNAFTKTNLVTKIIEISNNTHLGSPDHSIFELLSRFVNIEKMNLFNNKIFDVPSDAFLPLEGFQNKLTDLILGNIRNLGHDAFANLNNLTKLTFKNNEIAHIPENAFRFKRSSNKQLDINFEFGSEDNLFPKINISIFAENSLLDIKRPTELLFWTYTTTNIGYLPSALFKPFLITNVKNKIYLGDLMIDCNDCRNIWIKIFNEQVTIKCTNGYNLNHENNFKNCSTPN